MHNLPNGVCLPVDTHGCVDSTTNSELDSTTNSEQILLNAYYDYFMLMIYISKFGQKIKSRTKKNIIVMTVVGTNIKHFC